MDSPPLVMCKVMANLSHCRTWMGFFFFLFFHQFKGLRFFFFFFCFFFYDWSVDEGFKQAKLQQMTWASARVDICLKGPPVYSLSPPRNPRDDLTWFSSQCNFLFFFLSVSRDWISCLAIHGLSTCKLENKFIKVVIL